MMRALRYLLLPAIAVVLTGCNENVAVLNPKGTIALSQMHLIIETTVLMLAIVIPVIILNFMFAWHYRAKNEKAEYRPDESHNTMIEVVCWTIPLIIIAILAMLAWTTSHTLDPYRPIDPQTKPLRIEAIALNWKWLFIYPDENIAVVNHVEFPANTPVLFLITSDGPMNSLSIPNIAGQIYAMAGMRTKLYVKGTDLGEYPGFSANISGDGFSGMKFTAKVVTNEDFNKWIENAQHSPNQLTDDAFNELRNPSSNNPVQYYSSPAEGLFNKLIMNYMGPDMKGMNMSD